MKEEKLIEIEKQPATDRTQKSFLKKLNRINLNNTNIGVGVVLGLAIFLVVAIYGSRMIERFTTQKFIDFFDYQLFIFIGVGFLAQAIDGSLGMAYGATANSLLLGIGVPPVTSSAAIHFAEVFTTGASGVSHLHFGNVNKKLFVKLLLPGIAGAIIGASILSLQLDQESFKPYVSLYVLFLGLLFFRKALIRIKRKRKTKFLGGLALLGGFLDSIGGGGWGPIVTSTLLNQGRNFVYTIGSVNLAEFFVALASSITFVLFIPLSLSNWRVIVGLIVGGVLAAPFAAILIRQVDQKKMMLVVSLLIVCLSLVNFIMSIKL